jgi:hypothetical protein
MDIGPGVVENGIISGTARPNPHFGVPSLPANPKLNPNGPGWPRALKRSRLIERELPPRPPRHRLRPPRKDVRLPSKDALVILLGVQQQMLGPRAAIPVVSGPL